MGAVVRTDRRRPRVDTGRLGLLIALAGVVVTAYGEPAGASHMARFERDEYRVAENARSAAVVVVREDPKGALRVDYATADGTATAGSDYAAVSGTLEFADGQREASFAVVVTEDALPEDDESVLLILRTDGGRPDGIDGGVVPHETSAVLNIIGNDGGVAGTVSPQPPASDTAQPGGIAQPGSSGDPAAPAAPGDSRPSDAGQAGTAGRVGTPPADGSKAPSSLGSPTAPAGGEDGAGEEGGAATASGTEEGAVAASDRRGDTSGGGIDSGPLAALAGLALGASAGGGMWSWKRHLMRSRPPE